jgi:hypothetical protein
MKRKRRPDPLAVPEILRKLDEFREAGIGEGDKQFRLYFERLYRHTRPRKESEQIARFDLPEDRLAFAPGERVHARNTSLEGLIDAYGLEVADAAGRVVARDLHDFDAVSSLSGPARREYERFRKRLQVWSTRTRLLVCPEPWMDVFYISPALVFKDFKRLCPLPDKFLLNARNQLFAAQYFMVQGLEATWALRRSQGPVLRFFDEHDLPIFPSFWSPDQVSTTVAGVHGAIPTLAKMLSIPTDAHGWPIGRPYEALGQMLFENGLYIPLKPTSEPPRRNVIREAVQKGIAKAMVLRDITVHHDALRLDVDPTLLIAERYPKALQSVKDGLRDKVYVSHTRRDVDPKTSG